MSTGEVVLIDGKRVATPEYRSWQMMKNRCLNKNAYDYHHYGGRGILLCKRWVDFDAFLADMGRRPTPTHTLDRIDNNKGYFPWNCYWATRKAQSRNRNYCKLTEDKAAEIRLLARQGLSQGSIARRFGVSQSHVSQITRNKVWV